MQTVLVVTNRGPDDPGGRAEKVATRIRLFKAAGWNVELAIASEPYLPKFPLAVGRVVRRARAVNPDVVVSMVNPFHLHLLGYAASRVSGVPWVAEFRDPILTRPGWNSESLLRQVAAGVERFTARHADRVVWIDGIQLPNGYFETVYPEEPPERFVKLPYMGYERDRFEGAESRTFDEFTVSYAGSFYEGWIEPYGFLDGLAAYADRGHPDIVARFYGDWDEDYSDTASANGIGTQVRALGLVPHEELVPILKGSDVLLYIGGTDDRNRRNIPSKMWDYVGARRPILALADPEFAAAEFVEEHGLGIVAHPDDPSAIAAALKSFRTGDFNYEPTETTLRRFSRERHVEAYTDVLASVTDAN